MRFKNCRVKVMSRKRQWRTRKVNFTVSEGLLAHKLAKWYWMHVKARCIYAQPWRKAVPLQDQDVFSHFIVLAQILREENLDPQEFLRAQFEDWDGPSYTYPKPSQLHSSGAFTRFSRWAFSRNENDIQTDSIKQRKETGGNVFEYDRLKLKRLRLAHQLPGRKLLRMFHSSFSKDYLQHRGVWKDVKEEWLAAREDS